MSNKDKVNWGIVAVAVPILMGVMAWAYSIESRLSKASSTVDLSNRVAIIEELITPLVIEHKVEAKLKELGVLVDGIHKPGRLEPPHANPPEDYAPFIEPSAVEEIRRDAKNWAESQIRQEAN